VLQYFKKNLAANRRLLAKGYRRAMILKRLNAPFGAAIVLRLRPWMQTSCKLNRMQNDDDVKAPHLSL